MNGDAIHPSAIATLADVLLKGGALLILVFAAAAIARRRSAAERGLIWGLGLAGLLAVAIAAPLAPKWSWAVLPAGWGKSEAVSGIERQVIAPQASEEQPQANADDGADRTTDTPNRSYGSYTSTSYPPDTPQTQEAVSPPALAAAAAVQPAIPKAEPRAFAFDWPRMFLIGWGIGVLLALAPMGLGLIQVRRKLKRARPLGGADWAALMDELRGTLGIARPVGLLIGEAGEMPMAAGWLRETILLPAEAAGWPAAMRRGVLAHELAHVRRRDCLMQVLGRLAAALHWPDPLAWIALARLRGEREQACDDLALAAGSAAADYAATLLEIARTMQARQAIASAAATMARAESRRGARPGKRPGKIERRLLAILDASRRRGSVGRRGILLGLAAILLVALPLSMAQLVPSDAAAGADAGAYQNPDPVLRYLAWETRDDLAWNSSSGIAYSSFKTRAIWTPDGTAVAPGGIGVHPQSTFFYPTGGAIDDPPESRYLLVAFAFSGETPAWSELKIEEGEGVRQHGARSGEDSEQKGLVWQTYTLSAATTATLSNRIAFSLTYPAGEWNEAGTLSGTPGGSVDLGDGLSARAVRSDDPKFPGVRVEITDTKTSGARACKAEFVPNSAGRRAIERGQAGGGRWSDIGPLAPGKRIWSYEEQLLPRMIDHVRILTKPLKTARFEAKLLPFAETQTAALPVSELPTAIRVVPDSPVNSTERKRVSNSMALGGARALWLGNRTAPSGFGIEGIGLRPNELLHLKRYSTNPDGTPSMKELDALKWILEFHLMISSSRAGWIAYQIEFLGGPADLKGRILQSWLRGDGTGGRMNPCLVSSPHPELPFRIRAMTLRQEPKEFSGAEPIPEAMIDENLFDQTFTISAEQWASWLKVANADSLQLRNLGDPASPNVERFKTPGVDSMHLLLDPQILANAGDFASGRISGNDARFSTVTLNVEFRPEASVRLRAALNDGRSLWRNAILALHGEATPFGSSVRPTGGAISLSSSRIPLPREFALAVLGEIAKAGGEVDYGGAEASAAAAQKNDVAGGGIDLPDSPPAGMPELQIRLSEYAATLGEDVNFALAGFLAFHPEELAMKNIGGISLPPAMQKIADEWRAWSVEPENQRALGGDIPMEFRMNQNNGRDVDDSNGMLEIHKQAVEFAQRIDAALGGGVVESVDTGPASQESASAPLSGPAVSMAARPSDTPSKPEDYDRPEDPRSHVQVAEYFAMNGARALWQGNRVTPSGFGVLGIGFGMDTNVIIPRRSAEQDDPAKIEYVRKTQWIVQFFLKSPDHGNGWIGYDLQYLGRDPNLMGRSSSSWTALSGGGQSIVRMSAASHPELPFRIRVMTLKRSPREGRDFSRSAPVPDSMIDETILDQRFEIAKDQLESYLKNGFAESLQARRLGDPASASAERFKSPGEHGAALTMLLDPQVLAGAADFASGRIGRGDLRSSTVVLSVAFRPEASRRLRYALNDGKGIGGIVNLALRGEAMGIGGTLGPSGEAVELTRSGVPREFAAAVLREIENAGGKVDYGGAEAGGGR